MFNDAQPAEQVMLRYESITWKHHAASTSGFAFWGWKIECAAIALQVA